MGGSEKGRVEGPCREGERERAMFDKFNLSNQRLLVDRSTCLSVRGARPGSLGARPVDLSIGKCCAYVMVEAELLITETQYTTPRSSSYEGTTITILVYHNHIFIPYLSGCSALPCVHLLKWRERHRILGYHTVIQRHQDAQTIENQKSQTMHKGVERGTHMLMRQQGTAWPAY